MISLLPHNLIKETNIELFEQYMKRECYLYMTCDEKRTFLLQYLNNQKYIIYGHVRKFFLPSNIFWTLNLLDLDLNFIDKL